LIHHNKSGSSNPLDLVMASKAFTAVARSVHTVIRDPEDDTGETRMFGTVKNNLGRMDLPTQTFTIESWSYPTEDGETGSVGQLQWGANSTTTIGAALFQANAPKPKESKSEQCDDWLRSYMKLHGPDVNAGDVRQAAKDAGFEGGTFERSVKRVGVVRRDAVGDERAGPHGRQSIWTITEGLGLADSRVSADDEPAIPTLEDIR
jgi:hypothetical protein